MGLQFVEQQSGNPFSTLAVCNAFTVGRELFWGDDRLGDAVSWCHCHREPARAD
jgi:hypothetical protein